MKSEGDGMNLTENDKNIVEALSRMAALRRLVRETESSLLALVPHSQTAKLGLADWFDEAVTADGVSAKAARSAAVRYYGSAGAGDVNPAETEHLKQLAEEEAGGGIPTVKEINHEAFVAMTKWHDGLREGVLICFDNSENESLEAERLALAEAGLFTARLMSAGHARAIFAAGFGLSEALSEPVMAPSGIAAEISRSADLFSTRNKELADRAFENLAATADGNAADSRIRAILDTRAQALALLGGESAGAFESALISANARNFANRLAQSEDGGERSLGDAMLETAGRAVISPLERGPDLVIVAAGRKHDLKGAMAFLEKASAEAEASFAASGFEDTAAAMFTVSEWSSARIEGAKAFLRAGGDAESFQAAMNEISSTARRLQTALELSFEHPEEARNELSEMLADSVCGPDDELIAILEAVGADPNYSRGPQPCAADILDETLTDLCEEAALHPDTRGLSERIRTFESRARMFGVPVASPTVGETKTRANLLSSSASDINIGRNR